PYTTLFRSRRLGAKKRCDRLEIELAFIAGHGFVSGKCRHPEDHAQRQAESHDCGCELHRLASFRDAGFDIRCTAATARQTTKMGRLPQPETPAATGGPASPTAWSWEARLSGGNPEATLLWAQHDVNSGAADGRLHAFLDRYQVDRHAAFVAHRHVALPSCSGGAWVCLLMEAGFVPG